MVSALFGRDDEAGELYQAYELCFGANCVKPQHHLVLIHGTSGNGKTALATQTLRPLLAKQRGLFLTGKADATAQWSRPYDVFVSAFQQLVKLLENDHGRNCPADSMEDVREAIEREFGGDHENSINADDICLLSSIIPGFENVLQTITRSGTWGLEANRSASPIAEGRSKSDGSARLRHLLGRLCRTIASQRPLVLFLDDIHWCDRASLKLLESILLLSSSSIRTTTGTPRARSLMVVCAFRTVEGNFRCSPHTRNFASRDDNVDKSSDGIIKSALVEFLEECQAAAITSNSQKLHLHDVPLNSVDEATLNTILSGVYGLPRMEFYSHLIYKISAGNIYLALQCVRQLCDEGLLYQCEDTNEWKWDFSQLQAQDDATAQFLLNPAFSDIVRHGITQLPDSTQYVLSVASCFGMDIEEDVLALLFRDDEADIVPYVEKSLEEAADEGLIVWDPIICRYAFAHDRVQQAAHALIDDVDALSFEVGYKLWKRCPPWMLRSKIFAVVTLLNKGQSPDGDDNKITGGHMLPDDDCYAVAKLNWEAGDKAVSIAAFSDATRYLETGVALLLRGGKDRTYWQDEYQLTLDLLSLTAEVQMFNHNFERVKELVDEVCRYTKCLEDRLRVLMKRIHATSLQGRIQEAMDMGTDVLRQLGEKVPSRVTSAVVVSEQVRTKLVLRGKSKDALVTLPPMVDKEKTAVASVINTMFYFALMNAGSHTIVLAAKSIRLCLRFGSFPGSAMSFTMYGFALCGLGNVEEGFRFGELAMSMLQHNNPTSRDILPAVHAFFYLGVHHRRRPLREGIEGFKRGFRVGMLVGDLENAMINDAMMTHHCWFMGSKLPELDIRIMGGLSRQKVHNHPISHDLLQILAQVVDRLAGRSHYDDATEFLDAVRTETVTDETDFQAMSLYYHAALLAYIFRDDQQAHEVGGRISSSMRKTATSTFFDFLIDWIHGLTSVSMAREGENKRENLTNAKRALKILSRRAQECPCNCGHMYRLLKAEYESISFSRHNCTTNKVFAVLEHYDSAIEAALKEGFLNVAALAAERAGDYMMRILNADTAHKYWEKALSHYQKWGATEKARSMAALMKALPQQYLAFDQNFSSTKQERRKNSLVSVVHRSRRLSFSRRSMRRRVSV